MEEAGGGVRRGLRPHKRPACPRWRRPLQGRGGGGGGEEEQGLSALQTLRRPLQPPPHLLQQPLQLPHYCDHYLTCCPCYGRSSCCPTARNSHCGAEPSGNGGGCQSSCDGEEHAST